MMLKNTLEVDSTPLRQVAAVVPFRKVHNPNCVSISAASHEFVGVKGSI